MENGRASPKGSGDISMSDRGSTDAELLQKAGSTSRMLKFELQLYKLRDMEYCLDVQVRRCAAWPRHISNFQADDCKLLCECAAMMTSMLELIRGLCMQRLSGELFLFMDVCGSLLHSLRAY